MKGEMSEEERTERNIAIGNRIKSRREELGLGTQQIADKVGINNSTISRYENGKIKEPKLPVIGAIAKVLDVDPSWLLGKVKEKSPKRTLPKNLTAITHDDFKKMPRVGTIACGTPILAEQNINYYDLVPAWIHCDFTLKCQGDSMIGARIYDGDIVCIREQPEVENGEIAAVLIGEEATLKRVYRYGDTLVLRPENPQYQEMTYIGTDLEKVRVIGKATHFISSVK